MISWSTATRWICGDEEFRDQLRSNGLDSLAALSGPCVGEFVTSSRSSWVRRWSVGTTSFYIKTYDYPTWRDRSRGIGRTTLFLLDTNLPENPAEFRNLTANLYGGDRQTRLQQEILLGIGGVTRDSRL